MATGSNPEIEGTADDVLSSITETRAGLQSIPKELVEKDEYLQKWQERFDMEEVLNLSGSRLKKQETDVTDKEARLRDKELKVRNIQQEALKVVMDAKVRSKGVGNDIEAFEAKIAQLEVVEGQPQQEASSSKRPLMLSSADLNLENPSGTKRARPMPLPRLTDLPIGSMNASADTLRQRFLVRQGRQSEPA
ncbi:MAG: hypothetical protein Q9188_001203 [Gyalolechia gomerana]